MKDEKIRRKLAFYKGQRKRNPNIKDSELLVMWKAKLEAEAKAEADKKEAEAKAKAEAEAKKAVADPVVVGAAAIAESLAPNKPTEVPQV